jgi:hypothetical protein
MYELFLILISVGALSIFSMVVCGLYELLFNGLKQR